jgi:hypothetical protein
MRIPVNNPKSGKTVPLSMDIKNPTINRCKSD